MSAVSLISGKWQEKKPLFALGFFVGITANTSLLSSYSCFFRANLRNQNPTSVTLCQFEERNCCEIPWIIANTHHRYFKKNYLLLLIYFLIHLYLEISNHNFLGIQ